MINLFPHRSHRNPRSSISTLLKLFILQVVCPAIILCGNVGRISVGKYHIQSNAFFPLQKKYTSTVTPPPVWSSQTSGTTSALFSVSIVDDQVAWTVGAGGVIRRTTDGGATWQTVSSLPSDAHNVLAVSANVALACVNPPAGNDGRIYRTTNGGAEWSLVYQNTNTGAFIDAVYMFDAANGVAMGDPVGGQWVLLRTTNGGANWASFSSLARAGSEAGWNNSFEWSGDQLGWFGTNNSRVYWTTNGGASWSFATTPFRNSYGVSFLTAQLGMVGDSAAQTARSTSGGASWSAAANAGSGTYLFPAGVDIPSARWWMISGTEIYKTTDHGIFWSLDHSRAAAFYHIAMKVVQSANVIVGYAVGASGQISRYTEYLLPDLVWATMALSTDSFIVRNSVTADLTEQNIGNASAGSHQTQLYLSTDNIISTGDTPLGTPISFSSIAAGGSQTQSKTFTVPDVSNGIYYIGAIVDINNSVSESDESNNNYYRIGTVTIAHTTDLPPTPPALSSPFNGATNLPTTLTLSWQASAGATSYSVQVATDYDFNFVVVEDTSVIGISKQIGPLASNTDYYWHVRSENISGSSAYSDIFYFKTIPTASVSTLVSFPSNPASSTDYRLFSLPGTTSLTVGDILSGTQKIDWRMFRDNGDVSDYLIELSPSSLLNSGQGYWLLKKGGLNISRTMVMPPLSSDATYSIPLGAGWNIIGNPFDRDVPWSSVLAANGLPNTTPLTQYQGSYSASDTLKSFRGYYFFNSTNLTPLQIPYPFGGALQPVSTSSHPVLITSGSGSEPSFPRSDPDQKHVGMTQGVRFRTIPPQAGRNDVFSNWEVQLIFESDINRDPENYIGIASNAKNELDELDFRKPPLVFDQGFLYFSRPEWDGKYSRFSSDIRPVIGEGQVWEFEVSNPRKSQGKITFNGIEQIPPEYDVLLINFYNSAPVDLRVKNEYIYQTFNEKTPFKLIVGKVEFVRQHSSEFVPKEFALYQNYPNPFNPATSISFGVPRAGNVRLDIFSILGDCIRTLAEGWHTPALYTLLWDGTDQHGNPAASGVYFYRLTTDGIVIQSKKMILTR